MKKKKIIERLHLYFYGVAELFEARLWLKFFMPEFFFSFDNKEITWCREMKTLFSVSSIEFEVKVAIDLIWGLISPLWKFCYLEKICTYSKNCIVNTVSSLLLFLNKKKFLFWIKKGNEQLFRTCLSNMSCCVRCGMVFQDKKKLHMACWSSPDPLFWSCNVGVREKRYCCAWDDEFDSATHHTV